MRCRWLITVLCALAAVALVGCPNRYPDPLHFAPEQTGLDFVDLWAGSAMNNEGAIVGAIGAESVVWQYRRIQTHLPGLPHKPDPVWPEPRAISDGGVVVGWGVPDAVSEPPIPIPLTPYIMWLYGSAYGLYSYPDQDIRVLGVNESLESVGGITSTTEPNEWHAVRFHPNGEAEMLPSFGASLAYDISDHGTVAGVGSPVEGVAPGAMLWSALETIRLEGENSAAYAINDSGVAVGEASIGGVAHACAWDSRRLIDLGTPVGYTSRALDVNINGWIVGSMTGSDGMSVAMLWRPWAGGYQAFRIQDLLTDSVGDWRFEAASEVNNRGQILVHAAQDGATAIFLLDWMRVFY